MRPVVVQVFDFSLDGIIAGQDTEFYRFCRAVPDDPEHEAWLVSSLERAGVHIMGRVTCQMMAQYIPAAGGAIAAVMNRSPKAVFSRTLRVADWPGSVILSGDTAAEIDALRRHGTGEILAQGGASFAKSLVRLDVPDVYSLTVYPYLAGDGPRLFTSTQARELELISRTDFANGVLALEYRRRR